jgi:hypothetical protein
MQTYYPSLDAIHQQTLQLELEQCQHCQQTHQLVSHGFIRKKRNCADRQAVGKRVFCSNRHQRTGCGRTMQLYLDSTLRYLHHAGSAVVAFVLLLLAGIPIGLAYMQATGKDTPRHAYRADKHLPQPVPSAIAGATAADDDRRNPRPIPPPPRLTPLPIGLNLRRAAEALQAASLPNVSSAIATPILLTPAGAKQPCISAIAIVRSHAQALTFLHSATATVLRSRRFRAARIALPPS